MRRLTIGGLLLGLGLGGFVDGIAFHQILQWHHMLSDYGAYATTWPTRSGGTSDSSPWARCS